MINEDTGKPKFVNKPKRAEEIQRGFTMIDNFADAMKAKFKQQLSVGMEGWDDPRNLLELRKGLASHIERGMLARQDQEEDIGLFAAMVWHNRTRLLKSPELVASLAEEGEVSADAAPGEDVLDQSA